MKKNREKLNDRSPQNPGSQAGGGFGGQQSKTISLRNETIPAADRIQDTKIKSTATIIPFREGSYNTRVSVEQLSAIWNDGETIYSEAELLIIRDWLYTMADVITEVINSPGFIPPQISKTDAAKRKTKVISLPPTQPESTSINIPYYNEAKTAS